MELSLKGSSKLKCVQSNALYQYKYNKLLTKMLKLIL